MHAVYLVLGSNLGDRMGYLEKALLAIKNQVGEVLQRSSVYRTASWGRTELPEYLNQVLQVQTALAPQDLLRHLQQIEADLKRTREERWGSRTIDIDILFYDSEHVSEPNLIIPHPLLQERRFVLEPLMELAPTLVHPVLGQTVGELYSHLQDTLIVEKV